MGYVSSLEGNDIDTAFFVRSQHWKRNPPPSDQHVLVVLEVAETLFVCKNWPGLFQAKCGMPVSG